MTVRTFPIKYGIPALVAGIMLLLWAFVSSTLYNGFKQDLFERGLQQVKNDMPRIIRELEEHLSHGELDRIAETLATWALNPHYEYVIATDQSDKILYSSRLALVNQSMVGLLPMLTKERIQNLRLKGEFDIRSHLNQARISAIYPYKMAPGRGQLRSLNMGTVFVVYDLSRDMNALWSLTMQSAMPIAVGIAVILILLVVLIEFHISSPVNHLVDLANSVTKGDVTSRSKLQGWGELKRLGDVMNQMIEELINRQQGRLSAEAESRHGKALLESVFSALPDLFFVMDSEGRIIDYRAGKLSDLYLSPEKFLGQKMVEVLPPEVAAQFQLNSEQALQHEDLRTFEYALNLSQGLQYFEARLKSLEDGKYLIAVIRDVTDRVKRDKELIESEERFRAVFQSTEVGIVVANGRKGIITDWNQGAEHIFGYQAEEVIGRSIDLLVPERLKSRHAAGMNAALSRGQVNRPGVMHEVYGIRKNGEEFPLTLTLSSWQQQNTLYFSAVINDITVRKQAEEKIIHQAHFDSLTHLPNRFLSLDRLNQLLTEAKRSGDSVAVLFIDLDDFKKVNDTLGHETGDKLLVESAARLLRCTRRGDTVGRLGGDEFIIVMSHSNNSTGVLPVIDNILRNFRRPFKIDERELLLTASIGIAISPGDGNSASELLRNADSAMYSAKESGRNTYSYYTREMNEAITQRLAIEEQIHGALERNEFSVVYQPQMDVASQKIIAAEALLRWKNPALGEVPPDHFIPVAEQTGLIIPIGEFVLRQAVSVLRQWEKNSNEKHKIAVNLSPRQFRDPDLIKLIRTLIKDNEIDPACLELEITEGVLLSGHSYVEQTLEAIHELGVDIAMDDFGTGYSSLSYLRRYPFNVLKIDRDFVGDMADDGADRELVNAAVVMAHAMGIKVVAEGVETAKQLSLLQDMSCDIAQGYFIGRPEAPELLWGDEKRTDKKAPYTNSSR